MLRFTTVCTWLATIPFCALAGTTVTLVRDGRPSSAIVLATKPTRSAQLAAKELQHHVRLITGAELPILRGDAAIPEGHVPISVGGARVVRGVGLASSSFRPQEHLVRVTSDRVLLMGHDRPDYDAITYEQNGAWPGLDIGSPAFQVGTLYAVYDFLEALCGVRWYMVTDLGTVFPAAKTLSVPCVERRRRPWTTYRRIGDRVWAKPGTFGTPDQMGYVRNHRYTSARDSLLYTLRTRQNGSSLSFATHTLSIYNQRCAETHPDWFVGSAPGPSTQLRLWKDGVVEQVAKDTIDYFRRPYSERTQPDPSFPPGLGDVCKVAPLDNRKFGKDCQPPRQPERKGGFGDGQFSNYWFHFVNRVAKRVRKAHPDKWIAAPAYASHLEPPEFDLEPNVTVHVANTEGWEEGSYGLKNLRAWRGKVSRLFVYEYWYPRFGFPLVRAGKIAAYIERLREMKVEGWNQEFFGANPACEHRDFYVATKMLFDADAKLDDLLDEYYRLFYGPAERPMRRFWEAMEAECARAHGLRMRNKGLVWLAVASGKFMETVRAALEEAEGLATVEPYASRVGIIRQGVYGMMQQRIGHARSAHAARKRLACPRVTDGPQLDGLLEEDAWRQAATTSAFVSPNNVPVKLRTDAKITRDDRYLYLAFRCQEHETKSIRADCDTHDHRSIFKDDFVEIAVDTDRTRRRYCRLAINAKGVVFDERVVAELGMSWRDSHLVSETRRFPEWESGAEVAVARHGDSWTLELRIPLEKLGVHKIPDVSPADLPAAAGDDDPAEDDDLLDDESEDDDRDEPSEISRSWQTQRGNVWGLNFARTRARDDGWNREGRTTMWSPTFTDLNYPDEFGVLVMRQSLLGEKPALYYDFEDDFLRSGAVADKADVATDDGPTSSPAKLRVTKQGRNWDTENVAPGIKGRAIVFGGQEAGQFLAMKLSSAVNLRTDDFTISFWYRGTEPAGNLVACMVNTRGTRPHWYLAPARSSLCFMYQTGFIGKERGPGSSLRSAKGYQILSDGRWHHIVLMVDRGRAARLYLDKELLAVTDAGNCLRSIRATFPAALSLGTYYGCVNGMMDELMVFQGTFDAGMVERLYRRAAGDAVEKPG